MDDCVLFPRQAWIICLGADSDNKNRQRKTQTNWIMSDLVADLVDCAMSYKSFCQKHDLNII